MERITRRASLARIGGLAAISALDARLAFAAIPTDKRVVAIVLRGGVDGLGAVPPWGDLSYAGQRGALAFARPGEERSCLDLDGFFGLNPALANLHEAWLRKELLVLHAVASPYRDRSHFDAQDVLETGAAKPHAAADGWLARTLIELGGDASGLAIGGAVPQILRGAAPVRNWTPQVLPALDEDFLARLARLYDADARLGPVFRQAVAAGAAGDEMEAANRTRLSGAKAALELGRAAGRLLGDPAGPRIAALELGGWDTHANQGLAVGRLAQALSTLDAAVAGLKESLGTVWNDTAVLVLTEFGRTVRPNGTQGTDHGTGGIAFLCGGKVAGGRVVADWPGLSQASLHEGRDLKPTTDLRAALISVLSEHLDLARPQLDRIFPDSAGIKPLNGLLRSS